MCHSLTTATISAVFAEGVRGQSGRVTDTFIDGSRLFSRSLLPFVEEVRPNDRMQGGLALRATESEIWLHPYLFRQVCQNGAIMAHSLESCHVEFSQYAAEDDVIRSLQDAICACSERDVFTVAVEDIRTSAHREIDLALSVVSMMSQLQDTLSPDVVFQIFRLFSTNHDQSRFSLMNVVTSVARDTRDQEQRWRLEELGGGIGAGILPVQPSDFDGLHAPVHDEINVG